MSEDISNRTLTILSIVAIIFIFSGFIMTMNELAVFKFTGQQVQRVGQVGINITEGVRVTLINDNVDFGEGYIKNGFEQCTLTTYDDSVPSCWYNITPYPATGFGHFQLENTGNSVVNVTINSSNATNFFDGNITAGAPFYIWQGIHVTGDDGCLGSNLTTVATAFDETDQPICDQFEFINTNDQFNISIVLNVPRGPIGAKSSGVTFLARKYIEP